MLRFAGIQAANRRTPNLKLHHKVINSEAYRTATAGPCAATQKSGPTPLLDFLNSTFNYGDSLELLNANDVRMNQVVFAGSKLYTGVNTSVTVDSQNLQGIAYFIVQPSLSGRTLEADMSSEGYVAIENENVLFPSIGVNTSGRAIMTATSGSRLSTSVKPALMRQFAADPTCGGTRDLFANWGTFIGMMPEPED